MTPNEYHDLALALEDALFAADLLPNELLMARLVVKLSYRFGRTCTPQLLQQDFGKLCGIPKNHVKEVLGWILGKKIIELEAPNVFRPNPTPSQWIVQSRLAPEAIALEKRLLEETAESELLSQEEIRAGDPRVAFPDAATAVAAEDAGRKVPKFGTRPMQSSEIRNRESAQSSEIRNSSRPPAGARAPATCHDMVPLPTAKHEHDHVHAPDGGEEGELTAGEQDLLEQIAELTTEEGRNEHFFVTWRMRVREHPVPTFQAIGETRLAKREGRIRKSIGGALNWHFKNFREAARKQLKKVGLLFLA